MRSSVERLLGRMMLGVVFLLICCGNARGSWVRPSVTCIGHGRVFECFVVPDKWPLTAWVLHGEYDFVQFGGGINGFPTPPGRNWLMNKLFGPRWYLLEAAVSDGARTVTLSLLVARVGGRAVFKESR